jgi:hypothetical protein
LLHLINMSPMPQIGAATSSEVQRKHRDRISKGSDEYRVRSKGRFGIWGPKRLDIAEDSRNSVGRHFLIDVVKETIGQGHGRILGPVDVMISVLDTTCCDAGGIDEQTYLK